MLGVKIERLKAELARSRASVQELHAQQQQALREHKETTEELEKCRTSVRELKEQQKYAQQEHNKIAKELDQSRV